MAAWMLTKAGASVLMLEAGREYSPDESPMLNMAMEAALRGGAFAANPRLLKSDYRLTNQPDFHHIRFGFRLARTLLQSQ